MKTTKEEAFTLYEAEPSDPSFGSPFAVMAEVPGKLLDAGNGSKVLSKPIAGWGSSRDEAVKDLKAKLFWRQAQ